MITSNGKSPEREIITNKSIAPQEASEREPIATEKPRRKVPKGLIWATVGVGAIAAGIFGYR